MDSIGIKRYDAAGRWSASTSSSACSPRAAYSRSAREIPLLRHKVSACCQRAGFDPRSHDGKALVHILETFPRDELFQITDDELFDIALGILQLQERQRIALFVRRDAFERFVSCLVYVPRDRYNTDCVRRDPGRSWGGVRRHRDRPSTPRCRRSVAGARPVRRRDHAGRASRTSTSSAIEERLVEAGAPGPTACRRPWSRPTARRRALRLPARYAAALPCRLPRALRRRTGHADIEQIEEVLRQAARPRPLPADRGAERKST